MVSKAGNAKNNPACRTCAAGADTGTTHPSPKPMDAWARSQMRSIGSGRIGISGYTATALESVATSRRVTTAGVAVAAEVRARFSSLRARRTMNSDTPVC